MQTSEQASSLPTAAAVSSPQQAAALPTPEFQAMAFAALHHQSQAINELAEQVAASLRADHAAAAARGQAPASSNSSSSSSLTSTAAHLDFALPFASPAEASWMDRLMSRGNHSNYHGAHGQALEDWFNEYDMLFSVDHRFSTEAHKLLYACLHLKGEALRWFLMRERAQHYPPPGTTAPANIETWQQLKAELRAYFCPRSTSEEARRELHQLHQSQFSTLEGYIARFQVVSALIDVPLGQSIEPELLSAFKEGLKDGRIKLALTQANPKTFFEATQVARRAEADLNASKYAPYADTSRSHGDRTRHASHRPWHARPSASVVPYYSSARSYGGFTSNPQPAPVPMELGTIAERDGGEWQVRERTQEESQSVSPTNMESPSQAENEPEPDDSPSSYVGNEAASDREECYDPASETNALFRPGRRNTGARDSRGRYQPRERGSSAREQFLRLNSCWNCGRAGHMLRECPFQRKDGDGSGPPPAQAPGQGGGQGSRGAPYTHPKKM